MSAQVGLGQIILRFHLTATVENAKTEATMKLKDVFLGLCIVALFVSELFLFSANRQKDEAQSALRGANQQVSQLQNDLQQATNSNADIRNTEFSRLRNENQELPALRNQVQQLTATNRVLAQQLQATLTIAQQQQQQLQELQVQNETEQPQSQPQPQQFDTAAATQKVSQADVERNECLDNLRQIDAAKQQWALENGKSVDAVPTSEDLLPYLTNQTFPVCPSGGIYSINAVGIPPSCSIHGSLPVQ
jgi:DNA polymerase III gamma/tau subunit